MKPDGEERAQDDDGLAWLDVAAAGELQSGARLCARVGGRDIAVFRLANGELRACDNRCSHADASLSDGWLDGHVIECPLHGGRFDLDSGKAVGPPAGKPIEVFEVKVIDGRILVAMRPISATR